MENNLNQKLNSNLILTFIILVVVLGLFTLVELLLGNGNHRQLGSIESLLYGINVIAFPVVSIIGIVISIAKRKYKLSNLLLAFSILFPLLAIIILLDSIFNLF